MSQKGLVFDIDRFSTHDGPGIRTAIFLKGCPLSCKWCHSPESQNTGPELIYQNMRCKQCGNCIEICPENALSYGISNTFETGYIIHINKEKCNLCFKCTKTCYNTALKKAGVWKTTDELMEIINQDKPFYINSGGGITISGGEFLLQPEFTMELLSTVKLMGIHTAIETCGFGNFKNLKEISGLCDLIYYDIKIMDNEKHIYYTGVSNKIILDNISLLCKNSDTAQKITVRIPCIPEINDDLENITQTIRFIKDFNVKNLELLPYNTMTATKYDWVQKPYTLNNIIVREKQYYENLNKVVKEMLKC